VASSRTDLGLPDNWLRIQRWIYPGNADPVPATIGISAPHTAAHATASVQNTDWSKFPHRDVPRKPETRINIDRLEQLISIHEDKLLEQELARARRAVNYLRHGAPALQMSKLSSCLTENRLASDVAKHAVLKTVEEWIRKGFVAGPFKEPQLDNFRVNGMIAIIKGKHYFSIKY
jgi:hypothetical protein